jgi:SWI/SNF-related matrix-associated actin-dependent regulator of chromatin subfamily A3
MWRGGLLADEMGLGKTLGMIALIASDQDRSSSNVPFTGYPTSGISIGSTLIVVPLSCKGVCPTAPHKLTFLQCSVSGNHS